MGVDANSHYYTNMNFIFSQSVATKNSVRPSKGMAEGGCGGNSAVFLQKTEASPAALLVKAKHHRKILFSLGEKEIRCAQNEKSKEYFSVVRRALASGEAARQPFNLILVGCGAWIRTRINGFKGRCLAVGRPRIYLKKMTSDWPRF